MLLNNNTLSSSKSIIDTLQFVSIYFINHLPLPILILGIIGFIGNLFTFLQPNLRYNTCSIYSLSGSLIDVISLLINILHNYIYSDKEDILPTITINYFCKIKLFALVFLPELSMNLLTLASIDRYACTCSLTSSIQCIRQLKKISYLIGITIIITALMSAHAPIFYDVIDGLGCTCIYPIINGILYISMQGLVIPFIMLLFVLLTYRNVRKSRQRVGIIGNENINRTRFQFISMIFTQVFVTSFFTLQWICYYIFHITTQFNNKTSEQWAIHYFGLSITNKLYYIINVKSFYLSLLTSHQFRNTFITGLMKLFHKYSIQQNITKTRLAINITK